MARVSLHICVEVDDIVGALAEPKANGVKLIDDIPRIAHASARVTFLDPEVTRHLLIKLAELPPQTNQSIDAN